MMKMKAFLILAVALLSIGLITPVSVSYAQEEKILNVAIASEPPSIDPALGNENISGAVIRNTFERLTWLDTEGVPQPAAAESWEASEDGLTYTFHLREGSQWTNGKPVTAHDFEYSWKRTLNPETLSQSAALFYIIEGAEEYNVGDGSAEDVGVTALDDYTLEVTLINPAPYFLDLINGQAFSPVLQSVVEADPGWATEAGDGYVSNGPFTLIEWVHNGHITLGKNDTYWDSENVHLDQVNMQIIESQSTANNAFQAGEIDYVGNPFTYVSLDALEIYRENGQLTIADEGSVYYYTINTQDEIMSNLNMRKALALAIDRQSLIDNVLKGGENPAMGLVPPSINGFENKEPYFSDNDPEAAREFLSQALEELGLSDPSELTLSLDFNTSEAHSAVAQFIQNNWIENLGINVELSNAEWQVHLDNLGTQNYQVARLGWSSRYNDGTSLLNMYLTPTTGNNYTGWDSEEYRRLLEQADSELDSEKRIDLLKEAEALFIEEMPVIPIYYYSNPYVVQDHVLNMVPDSLGHVNLKPVDIVLE